MSWRSIAAQLVPVIVVSRGDKMKFMSAAFQKEMTHQLRVAVKGTGWKHAKGVVFRQSDEWFIAGHWRNVGADPAAGLRVEIMAKPMAIDPMLWDVMELQENNKQPLSFRYWGAFICGTPVLKHEIIHEIDPAVATPLMLETLDRLLPDVLLLLETTKFSDLAKNPAGIHDNWRLGETVTHALRLENEPDLAAKNAQNNAGAYSKSSTTGQPKTAGKSHNDLVVSAIREEVKKPYARRLLDRLLKN